MLSPIPRPTLRRIGDAMPDVVVDSSVIVRWVLPESDSPAAEQFGLSVVGSGGRLIVLDLAFAELPNAL